MAWMARASFFCPAFPGPDVVFAIVRDETEGAFDLIAHRGLQRHGKAEVAAFRVNC